MNSNELTLEDMRKDGVMDKKSRAYKLANFYLRRAENACWDLSGTSERCLRWRCIVNAILQDDEFTINWVLTTKHTWEKGLPDRRAYFKQTLIDIHSEVVQR